MSRKTIEQLKASILNNLDIGQEFTYTWVEDVAASGIPGVDLEIIVTAVKELAIEGRVGLCEWEV
jgi:hypothetical protein